MGVIVTTTYTVAGMTCAHCVRAVTSALLDIETVTNVEVLLVPDGVSQVTVSSSSAVDRRLVRAAVAGEGYAVVGAAA